MDDKQKRERIEAIYARSKRLFPDVPELTIDELDRLSEATEIVLVDVRAEKEQVVSMIPGAISVARFDEQSELYAGKTIVAYCTVGHRSGIYARKLLSKGWHVYNLKGAILAWTHAGRELVVGGESTRRVHVAGPKWSLEAEGYQPIW